jgi:glutamate dehydrogenase
MPKSKITEAKKLLPSGASNDLKAFFDSFYKDVPEEDLALITTNALFETINTHWKMRETRKPGVPLVKVHTPSVPKGKNDLPKTVIDIVSDDMSFLIDSIAAEIARQNRVINVIVHPVFYFIKEKKGKISGKQAKKKEKAFAQSHIHIELGSAITESQLDELQESILRVIRDVNFATQDWLQMKERLLNTQVSLKKAPKKYKKEEIEEYNSFIEYLHKDNFTLLGLREYRFISKAGEIKSQTVRGSSLGLLRDEIKPVYISKTDQGLTQELQKLRHRLPPLSVSKVNKRSTVHRSVPLDAIAIKQYDDKGKVVGECLFIGLFTSVTYSRSIEDVPYLRAKAEKVMHLSGFDKGSHDHKALRHILEKYPRDELFQIEIEDLLEKAISILHLQERPRISLYIRPDAFGRYMSCLVYVPRERYDTRLRKDVQQILEKELHGECGSFYTTLDDSPLARVMCIIYVDQKKPQKFDINEITNKLQEAGRIWSERLIDALQDLKKEEEFILNTVHKYGESFPYSYQIQYSGKQAVYDIEKIETVLNTGGLAIDFYEANSTDGVQMRLKLYHPQEPIILSDILPMLENMGLKVLAELPFEIRPLLSGMNVWIHDFHVELKYDQSNFDMDEVKSVFEEALEHIWSLEAENDSLNRLVLAAKMSWRDIIILRSYTRFLRQAGYSFGTRFMESTLVGYADISRHIVDLFKTLHNPDRQSGSEAHAAGCLVAIDHAMENVVSLDEDRVLRSVLALVDATLRTNYFQKDDKGNLRPCLALKFDSQRIVDLPEPRPFREIFVYASHVEGVHLRGDKISRGGIRWSDRHEDFRTEILGLMKAQQVKNSLIVPMGAKGGFVVKRPPAGDDRQSFIDNGIECYKDFIRSLLDITDNRKGSKVIPPKDVVRKDEDDPYLVVAADKGTATFSDIANKISEDYGFWLSDAFASGGSAGYDHKKMGITARGAWESIKRHFREFNHNTQTSPFEVVGVGDMGGDVFGNGMLLSKKICLVGAFNHMHIFCDPDPDPEVSFKERARLFKAVKGWGDYNSKKLSKGGKVYDRSQKNLKLTPEIKKKFGLTSDKVSPPELIKAMLAYRTDLLWFGGIGTYIKDKDETNLEVGDKANDSLRLNAQDINARVIGEGANLAVTQKARVALAKSGIKLNADFIDNSAGVDCSDHEVNIKILMADVLSDSKNKMDVSKRDKLLEKMTDEVASLVLYNNYQQVQAISLMEVKANKKLASHSDFISYLEESHEVNRGLESLPSIEEIEKRQQRGKGLNRPELSVVQAYAKILLSKELLGTDFLNQNELTEILFNYFPVNIQKKYSKEILEHRLSKEIIATMLSVNIINRMGPVFIKEQQDKAGVDSEDVVRAYMIVENAFDLPSLWKQIESLDNVISAQVQLKIMYEISKVIRRETRWILSKYENIDQPIDQIVGQFRDGISILKRNLRSVLTDEHKQNVEQLKNTYVSEGIPEDLAVKLALMPMFATAFDMIRVGNDFNSDIPTAAHVYFQVGESLRVDWLRRQARYLTLEDKWSIEAVSGLLEQFDSCQAGITARILHDMKRQISKISKKKIVQCWIDEHESVFQKTGNLFSDMKHKGSVDLSMLIIAEQRLRSLYDV